MENSDGSVELTPGLGFYTDMVVQDKTVSKVILQPYDKSLSIDDKNMKKIYSSVASASKLNQGAPVYAPVIRRGR